MSTTDRIAATTAPATVVVPKAATGAAVGARMRRVAAGILAATTALAAFSLPSATTASATTSAFAPVIAANVTQAQIDPAVAAALQTQASTEVIVRATPAAIQTAIAAVVENGGTLDLPLPIIDGFSATITPAGLAALTDVVGVVSISRDGKVSLASGAPAGGPTAPDSIFPQTIGAQALYAAGFNGAGVGIAILDTGVSPVGDLAGRIVGAVDLAGDGDQLDHYGHGTFIAGVAAASGAASNGEHAGVAPGAHIIPVKITGIDGSSDVAHVLAGIQYAVSFKTQYNIGVINLSLGTDSLQSWQVDPMNYAVQKAWDAGIVVVVSGANLGPGAQTITKPADDPLVIAVGSTDSHGTVARGDDTVASFSSRGPTRADSLAKPDLVAPGVSLVGLKAPGSYAATNFSAQAGVGTDYFRGSGTSFSTGVVTGAVALLRQAHPTWTPNQIKGALIGTAAPGPVGQHNVDGYGAIDVAAASALVAPAPANQGVMRGTGTGSLVLSRGSLQVQLAVPDLNNPLGTVNQLLAGEMTPQGLAWSTYASSWYASSWYASSWYASSWYASSWYASSWYASSWYASSWYASSWY